MADAGVPTLGYNFKPIGNFRTTSATGRGGSKYSTFDYGEWQRTKGEWPDKQIDEASMWANIQYFLERIVPEAEACGVRLALHPDDPPIPEAMGGAMRIVSTLDQYERIFGMAPSDANAMLFCQGCVTEMGVDVYDAIRRIGSQGKIVYVHFRNVKGSGHYFEEVFIDEGDVDMLKAMQVYKEIGFQGPFMMDHTPSIPGQHGGLAGHALAAGYMRAMPSRRSTAVDLTRFPPSGGTSLAEARRLDAEIEANHARLGFGAARTGDAQGQRGHTVD